MDNIQTKFVNADALVADLGGRSEAARISIFSRVRSLTEDLETEIKANLSGKVLKPGNPPALRDSVDHDVVGTELVTVGRVFTGDIPYAEIQEHGGKIRTPDIYPVSAAALAFISPGGLLPVGKSVSNEMTFAMHTAAHDTNIPERSYARRALAQMKARIIAELTEATILPLMGGILR